MRLEKSVPAVLGGRAAGITERAWNKNSPETIPNSDGAETFASEVKPLFLHSTCMWVPREPFLVELQFLTQKSLTLPASM